MIKKLKLGLLILCMPVMAFASQFQNGVQYTELQTEKTAKPQVTEFFSYFCGHCYKMEPVAKGIEKNLPAGVPFIKSHVNFLKGKSAADQSNLSYAYLIAKQQAKEHQVSDAIFNYIHRQSASFSNMKDVSNLLALNGISKEDFDSLLSSTPVNAPIFDYLFCASTIFFSPRITGMLDNRESKSSLEIPFKASKLLTSFIFEKLAL
jgi:thiol:disulfide interchange protein DsbA